jgi:GTP-binding protein
MAFIDEVTLSARAGNGGDGTVAWLHLKGKEFSGPAGGNGGDGGNVSVRAIRDLTLLARYRGEKLFAAGDGERGGSREKHGARGKDLLIDVPVGSLVRNEETREVFDLTREGEIQLVLKGGRGGAGNAVFKSSVNQSPEESTPGGMGERAKLTVELRLIADAGLVGLPNAGKTSLLNALTHASGKVGAYPFTTLEPNLGMLFGFVIADIPGLIEGASEGKGLGIRFLRHISRTRLLLHCLSLDSADPLGDYQVVRKELDNFEGGALAKRPEVLILTKSDTRDSQEIQQISDSITATLKKTREEIFIVSVLEDASVEALSRVLVKHLAAL